MNKRARKNLKIRKIRKKKIDRIKRMIAGNTYPPEFDESKWDKVYFTTNCYAYALDIPIEDPEEEYWIPGCIQYSIHVKTTLWTGVTEKIKKDLDVLKIKYREDDGNLNDGEYRIAIYFRPTPHDWPIGFHISRQDKNGIWSEMKSWNDGPTQIGDKRDTPPDLSEHGLVLESVLILSK